jgi:hypothetical protein
MEIIFLKCGHTKEVEEEKIEKLIKRGITHCIECGKKEKIIQ